MEEFENDEQQPESEPDELFKHWYKSKGQGGFLSLRQFFSAGKISVDIGKFGEGGLQSSSKAYANAIELSVYCQAVRDGIAANLYPARQSLPTDESFGSFGGRMQDGKPIARVIKIHLWTDKNDAINQDAFAWKVGIFDARKSNSGAFIPDMSKPVSVDLVKISRAQMAEIAYRLDLGIRAFTHHNVNWLDFMNGRARG